MSDQLWVDSLKEIDDPLKLLKELVELDDHVGRGVGDPYYRDLYQGIIDQARVILAPQPPQSFPSPGPRSAKPPRGFSPMVDGIDYDSSEQ